jgi:hypothetical protein
MKRAQLFSRGFTIVEMMVVCVVAFVILALLADVFIEALQRTHDGRMRVDMQQRAIFALGHWERDIEKTSQRTIVVKPGDPLCVGMTQAAFIDANGSVNWRKEIICWAYKKADRTWQRELYPSKEIAFAKELSSTTPYLPTFSELDSLTSQVSGAEKIMCDNVEDFSLTDRNGNTASLKIQPLIFRLKLRRPLSTSQRFAEFTIDRRYTLRNSF